MISYTPAARIVVGLDFASCGLAEAAKVCIHCTRMTQDKTRHETEDGIVDLGFFGDADSGVFSIWLKGESPCAGVGQVFCDDAALQGTGRCAILEFIVDGFSV